MKLNSVPGSSIFPAGPVQQVQCGGIAAVLPYDGGAAGSLLREGGQRQTQRKNA